MIKVSIVSYFNTIPLQYGLQQSDEFNSMAILSKDIPSECAHKLIQGETDVGLVPVAVIPQIKNASVISNYCIAAEGAVDSVLLLSDVELSEITTVLLDYQSKTSIRLVQLLAQQYWNIKPEWVYAQKGFENDIKGTVAGVVIGDRTFNSKMQSYKYRYDLSQAWYQYTKKPFVFACWVCNNTSVTSNSNFIDLLNKAMKYGITNIDAAIDALYGQITTAITKKQLRHYLTEKINYNYDSSKQEAMNMFLQNI